MIFGKKAWDNANLSPEDIRIILNEDVWRENDVEEFINFWANVLSLTYQGMEKRIDTIYRILNENINPTLQQINTVLKKKQSRWKSIEINRICPIILRYIQNIDEQGIDLLHSNFQYELGDIGPVYTVWCHYLLSPTKYPPIDRLNYTAYKFITAGSYFYKVVPAEFVNPFPNQGYNTFKDWFIDLVSIYRGVNYTWHHMKDLDKALISFGSFIRKVQ
jgi:hypothetical protein